MSLLAAELRPAPTRLVLGGGTALVALGVAAGIVAGPRALLAVLGLLALVAAAYLAVWASPALLVSGAIGCTIFSGHFDRLGLPLPLDRLLVAAGVGSLFAGLPGAVRARQIIWRPVHAVIAATAVYAALSALAAGTLLEEAGLFGILDRLGLVPFALFVLAPLLFGNRRQRDVLLTTLLVVGSYLGFVALCQGLNLDGLVWPRYITDPGVGLHPSRARGPFVEAVANGLALYACAVAGALAAYTWVGRRARWWGAAVCVLCLVGTIFTLTRSIWVGSVLGTVVALLMSRQTRRALVPMLVTGAVVALAALALVPGFGEQAESRSGAQRPIWDRYNTNLAAIRAVEDQPIFGIGWQRWQDESSEYLRLSEDYPLTGTRIEIHNVFLSHAAELGLLGAGMWLFAFTAAIGGAVLRPGPAELDPWRLGMIAITVQWLVVAAFGPLSYAFPNVLLWTWAGICCLGHLSRPVEVDA